MSDYETITLEMDGNLAVLTLNAPDKLNALSGPMKRDLRNAFHQIATGVVAARALLITGAGRAFCAGGDLSDPEGGFGDPGRDLMDNFHAFLLELSNLNIPVVSAVNGVAAGAGMSLSLTADFVFAARSAYFLQAFVNIGLVPDAGSSFILPRLIGEARTREIAMLGERLPAEKAESWGMIYKCVDDDKLMDEAVALAQRLANGPTQALGGIRTLIRRSATNSYAEQLQEEAMMQRQCSRTKDCAEGIGAFLQKRKAEFTGT